MVVEKPKRSIVKAFTWRAVGTLTLFILTYSLSGSQLFASIIAVNDIIGSIVLFYLHERFWEEIDWGKNYFLGYFFRSDEIKRSITKAISWRISMTLYLFIFSLFYTKQLQLSFSIALFDALINIIEYYLHERIWNSITWGR